MLIRETPSICLVMLRNGLTFELTYEHGSSYGVWLFGEQLLWCVVAAAA
jgi:hypothetical protein